MKKIRVYFDCDGVILDTINRAVEIARTMGYNPDDSEDFHNFFLQVNWHELVYEAGILNDSLEKIRRVVRERPEYEVYILTKYNPENLTEEAAKRYFFSMFLPDVEVIMVPFSGHKHETVNPVDSILIDDSMSNVNKWHNAGGVAVRFMLEEEADYDHNVINDLDDFEKTDGVKTLLKARNI